MKSERSIKVLYKGRLVVTVVWCVERAIEATRIAVVIAVLIVAAVAAVELWL